MKANKTENIALRLEPELRAKIERAAEEDRRPVASFVRVILEDWASARPVATGTHRVAQPQS